MVNRIKNEILKYFPLEMRNNILQNLTESVREVRMRVNRPILLKTVDSEIIVECLVTKDSIKRVFESICSNSVYAFEEEISNGFITIQGGHRVGICGKPLYRNEKIYSIKDVSGLNFRIAREIKGVADRIIPQIKENDCFVSTLILSPPGLGKTTLLRDLVRQVSDAGYSVSLVDERSEVAGCFLGIPQNDVGLRTDVMDAVYKPDGIRMMVRSMCPDFVATDEIGTDEDAEAIFYAVNCGTKILATAHGERIEDLYKSKKMKDILQNHIFEKMVVLSKSGVKVV